MSDVRDAGASRRSVTLALVGALLATMLATGLTQAASATITMDHYVFTPSPLTIAAGTVVTWVNKDPTEHQVVSDTGAFPSSKLLKTSEKYSVTFSKAGTFNYHDGFGGFMRGTIIVTAAPKATPKPTPRPTVKPTVKPTAKPTVKPTPAPAVTAAATEEPTAAATVEPSPGPTDAGATASATPGSGASAAPGSSGGDGSSSGSGSGSGSLDIGSILFGLALAVLLFFAWIGVQTFRRNQPGPPSGGGGGSSGGGGSGGGGGAPGGSCGSSGPGGPAAVESAPVAVSPATRRLARRPAPPEPFDDDAPSARAD